MSSISSQQKKIAPRQYSKTKKLKEQENIRLISVVNKEAPTQENDLEEEKFKVPREREISLVKGS